MIKWIKSLFLPKKKHFVSCDVGSTDKSTYTYGYFDRKGNIHITEVKQED